MTRLNLLIAMLISAVLATDACAEDKAPPTIPDKDKLQVFLLAGQSNMAGRGEITEDDLKIHPRVLMLAKDGSWQYAVAPVHYDKKVAGVGLARTFAIELAEKDKSITIGLVPAAVGGTPIALWEPGAYDEKTDTHPYDDAISRTKRALQDGTLSGILWHQGEGDSGSKKWPLYEERLLALVGRFRKDLDAPEVPFIIGQLGRFEAKPWSKGRHQVNEAQINVVRDTKFSGFVSSFGLTSKPDNTHFNTPSLHEFGKRYAIKYLQVVAEGDQPSHTGSPD